MSNFNIPKLKEQIDTSSVYEIVDYLGGEPEMSGGCIISKTISHGGDSRKLYYYPNTKLFIDYTDGSNRFDLFELVSKVLNVSLNDAIWFVVSFLHMDGDFYDSLSDDWASFDRYSSIRDTKDFKYIDLPELDPGIIENYPSAVVTSWVESGIPYEMQQRYGIKFNPTDSSILIPHRDMNGRLVGIRKRALVESDIESGKYRPAVIGGEIRSHPLAFNLYGLDMAKDSIRESGFAIVAEGEKSVLESNSFGVPQTVACCGSSLSAYQMNLLMKCGAKEIVIGFDADYKDIRDGEAMQVVSRLMRIYKKVSPYMRVSFLWDKSKVLGYKDSPFDKGKEVFLKLWKNRIYI